MQQVDDQVLSERCEKGDQLIQENYRTFSSLLTQAKKSTGRGHYSTAAVYGQMAASYAQCNHCGMFASAELEKLLITIGQQNIKFESSLRDFTSSPQPSNRFPKNILHVSSITPECAGIPKLLGRWIQQDAARTHSIALTKQAPQEVPKFLREAVEVRKGKIFLLNQKPGSLIERAKRLRQIAISADLVVLHTWEHDVVPVIAFAQKENLPPIIYVNSGDHWFWVGVSIADAVANLRESGLRLSQARRGIEASRNLLLPTILNPIHRFVSRMEAKQQLGIDQNCILLLSIARGVKYKTSNGTNFADAHVSLLKKFPQTRLIVVGPGAQEDWSEAIEQTGGRIQVFGETPDTTLFYQAADIYVDSFPFVSITSLLEAGSYGTPLVSRYPYNTEACMILGSDMPGLTNSLIRVFDLASYTEALSRLIQDEEYRLNLGQVTRQNIEKFHWGDNWQFFLEKVYSDVIALPKKTHLTDSSDHLFLGEPDVYLPLIHKTNFFQIIQWHMTLLPLLERLRLWIRLVKENGFKNTPKNLLMPEWLKARYYLIHSQTKA